MNRAAPGEKPDFEDLLTLSSRDFGIVIAHSKIEIMHLAMRAASEELKEAFFHAFDDAPIPEHEKWEWNVIPPIASLATIQDAQKSIVSLAMRLARNGKIARLQKREKLENG